MYDLEKLEVARAEIEKNNARLRELVAQAAQLEQRLADVTHELDEQDLQLAIAQEV